MVVVPVADQLSSQLVNVAVETDSDVVVHQVVEKVQVRHQFRAGHRVVPHAEAQHGHVARQVTAFLPFLNLSICLPNDLSDRFGVDSRALPEVLVNLPAGVQSQELNSCVGEEKSYALLRPLQRVRLLANLLETGGERLEPLGVVQFISYQEPVTIFDPV